MTELILHVRNFFVLSILLLLLLQLVPGKELKKYIRFFSQLLLTLGFLYPVLSLFTDSEAFLEKVQYEAFAENTAEISRDAAKLEDVQQEYYLEKYEEAVAHDVYRIAQAYAEPYGLCVREVEVGLSGAYKVEKMSVALQEKEEEGEGMETFRIAVGEGKKEGREEVCEKLKAELEDYYQLEGTEAYVWYAGG